MGYVVKKTCERRAKDLKYKSFYAKLILSRKTKQTRKNKYEERTKVKSLAGKKVISSHKLQSGITFSSAKKRRAR